MPTEYLRLTLELWQNTRDYAIAIGSNELYNQAEKQIKYLEGLEK